MNFLLSEWRAFCEGEILFDKAYFLGLLKLHSGAEDLNVYLAIFRFRKSWSLKLDAFSPQERWKTLFISYLNVGWRKTS